MKFVVGSVMRFGISIHLGGCGNEVKGAFNVDMDERFRLFATTVLIQRFVALSRDTRNIQ